MNASQVTAAVLEYVRHANLAKCEITDIRKVSSIEWIVELTFELEEDVAVPDVLLVTVNDSSGEVHAVQY